MSRVRDDAHGWQSGPTDKYVQRTSRLIFFFIRGTALPSVGDSFRPFELCQQFSNALSSFAGVGGPRKDSTHPTYSVLEKIMSTKTIQQRVAEITARLERSILSGEIAVGD